MADKAMDMEALREDLASKANEALAHVIEFAREKPHAAVGIALGVGWVLGNGLPPRVIMGAARLGWKAMLGGALAGSGLTGILGGEDASSGATGRGATGGRRASATGAARTPHDG